jgi:hypothetical protein
VKKEKEEASRYVKNYLGKKYESAFNAIYRAAAEVEELSRLAHVNNLPITEEELLKIEGVSQSITEYLGRMRVLRLRLNR